MNKDEREKLINILLKTLKDREEKILRWYFGFGYEKKTPTKIGEYYDITKRSVKRIKNRGVRKMIHHIFFPSMVETFGELASHIDKDLIEQCIKERGKLLV